MPATYEPIATTTLSTNTATVTFSSISGTFTDLVLIANYGHSATDQALRLRFNSDTGSNYSLTSLYGNGTSAGSVRASNQTGAYIAYYVDAFTSVTTLTLCHIMNYSNTTTNKTIISRTGRPDPGTNLPGTEAVVNLWRNTGAITTIDLSANSGNLLSGSTFTLYGIKAA